MKTNQRRFPRSSNALACLLTTGLLGLGLSANAPALEPGALTGPVLDRLDRQVERTVSRQIERRLEAAAESAPVDASTPGADGSRSSLAAVAELPARLSIRSTTGREVFADVEVEDGWRAVERQWLITVEADELHHFQQPGIQVLEQTALDGLGLTVLRFQASQSLDSRDQLQRLLPNALLERLDRNHIYQPETEANARTGPASEENLPPANTTPSGTPSCQAPVTIGMVDTAIDLEHPAFAETTVRQRDFLAELALSKGFQPPTDHGTAVASRLTGRTASTATTRLPGATLLNATVFFDRPSAISGATLLHLVQALDWLQTNEVALINVSMAGPDNRVLARVIERLQQQGTPVVAAVGNGGPAAPVLYPAGYPGVIGVTAVDRKQNVYRWANRGEQVDFAALGVEVAVALAGGQYGSQSGTSLAAPVVSARLACVLSTTGLEQALAELRRTAQDLGDRGPDPIFGQGLLPDDH